MGGNERRVDFAAAESFCYHYFLLIPDLFLWAGRINEKVSSCMVPHGSQISIILLYFLNLKDTKSMIYNRKVYNCLKKRWYKMSLDLIWGQKFILNHLFLRPKSMSLEDVWLYQDFKKHRLVWKSVLLNSPDDLENYWSGWHPLKQRIFLLFKITKHPTFLMI